MCLSHIFWNPKLHKNPYKARFIAGAKRCALKPLNILVNCCPKFLKEYFQKYCQTIDNNSGINFFWSIESSTEILETFKNNNLYILQIYDYTTLYTTLDLSEVIDRIFSNLNKYMCICKYNNNQFFSKKEYSNHYCFTKEQLKEAVNFIVYNTFIVFVGQVFIQTRVSPWGVIRAHPQLISLWPNVNLII